MRLLSLCILSPHFSSPHPFILQEEESLDALEMLINEVEAEEEAENARHVDDGMLCQFHSLTHFSN